MPSVSRQLIFTIVLATVVPELQARYFCPTPWTQYFDRCIRLFTISYQQSAAATYCAGYNNGAGATGKLYAPRTRQDLAIFDHIDWVTKRPWIGAVRNTTNGNKFFDSEGNQVPDNLFYLALAEGDGLNCAVYNTDLGRLELRSCSNSHHFYCQLPATTPSDTCSPSFLPMFSNMDLSGTDDRDRDSTGLATNYPLYYFYPIQYGYADVYGLSYCGDDERTPLLLGIPGNLSVSFSASSFVNYARPEYVLINNTFQTGSHRVCKWYREYYGDLDVNQNGEACIPYSAWPAATNKCRTSTRTYSSVNYYSGRGMQSMFAEFFMNKKVKLSSTYETSGFSLIRTSNYESTVTAESIYYVLIDLKTPTFVTLIIPYTTSVNQMKCIWTGVSNTWNSSLDEAAFDGWTSCGVQERADPSDGHLFFHCPPGTIGRYAVITRRKSCGYHTVDHVKIYGDHYYDVNFIPGSSFVNRIPESMEKDLQTNRNVTFSTLIRDTYADFFLTAGTTYSSMLDQRIRFRLTGDSASNVLWISNGWVLNKAISSSEIPLNAVFLLNKTSTLAQMGSQNVFDFHDLSFKFEYNSSADENLTIEAYIDSTLVGVFSDPSDAVNFTINSAGFSKKPSDTEYSGVAVQFPGVPNSINAGFWQPSAFYGDDQDWHQVAFSSLVWVYYAGYSRGSDSQDQDQGAVYTVRLWSSDLVTWIPLDMGLGTSRVPFYVSNTYKHSNFVAMKPPKLLLGMRHVENSYSGIFQLKFMLYGKVANDMSGGSRFPWLISRYQPVRLSSQYSSTYPGYKATDGMTNTYGSTHSFFIVSSSNKLRWAYVDMIVPRNFSYVVVYTRNAADAHIYTIRNTGYFAQLATMSGVPTFEPSDLCYQQGNTYRKPDDLKYIDYLMFPCAKTARYLTVRKDDGITEYLSIAEIEVYGTIYADPQLNALAQVPMGLGEFVHFEWMVSGSTQNPGGLFSLPLSAAETPFVDYSMRFQSIGTTSSYVRFYFPISMTVTGMIVQGSGKRSKGLRGCPYNYRLRYSQYKDSRRMQDVKDQANNDITFKTIQLSVSTPGINFLPHPIETQLFEAIMLGSWHLKAWKIEVLGFPSAALRSVISTSNYTVEKIVTEEEQVIRIDFKEIFYLTSIRVSNLDTNKGFYLTYRVTQNSTDRQLRTPWYDQVYNFSSLNLADDFFMPVIFTPISVELHFQGNASVQTTDIVNIRGVEINDECPQGWRPLYNICLRIVPSALDWNSSLQYCQSRYWNGKNGTLFMPKTAVLRNFGHMRNMQFHVGAYRNSSTGRWYWLDGEEVEQGAFYMGQPQSSSCVYLSTDYNGLYKIDCSASLYFLCQIPKKIWPDREQTVLLNTFYSNGVGATDDSQHYTQGPMYELLSMWTMDDAYKYIPVVYDTWNAANTESWAISIGTESLQSSTSKTPAYQKTRVENGCLEPLLYPEPGMLGVRINASSSNSRRGPEKAFLGSVMSREDHVQCALSRADYQFYDGPWSVTEQGYACANWDTVTSTYKDYNNSCLEYTTSRYSSCYDQAGAIRNCYTRQQAYCSQYYYPPANYDYISNILTDKVAYFIGIRQSYSFHLNYGYYLNTDVLSVATPPHNWWILLDLKLRYKFSQIRLDPTRSLYNVSFRTSNSWNRSLGDLAFEHWDTCFNWNFVEPLSTHHTFINCDTPQTARYLVLVSPVNNVGNARMDINYINIPGDEVNEVGMEADLRKLYRLPKSLVETAWQTGNLTFYIRLNSAGLQLLFSAYYAESDIMKQKRYEFDLNANGTALWLAAAAIRQGDFYGSNRQTVGGISLRQLAPVAADTEEYLPLTITWTDCNTFNCSIYFTCNGQDIGYGVVLASDSINFTSVSYLALVSDSMYTGPRVMFDMP
uniref:C-type lectin domain-containing protein n=1 Tax=Macrostomum lignano TaxID=282301 RepID=A0A1I8G7N1_9PLAT